ncbi:MAG: hypothetical protein R3B13_10310 [Polyangiaceae bacterium]
MTREVFFLIGRGGAILFGDASNSASALPDSRTRWEIIWQHRDELEELTHSHPNGPLAFSKEDETTMAALESALGKTLRFSVVAPSGTIVKTGDTVERVDPEPWWADLLRLCSGMALPAKPPPASIEATAVDETSINSEPSE